MSIRAFLLQFAVLYGTFYTLSPRTGRAGHL